MKHPIESSPGDGGSILVEVDGQEGDVVRTARSGEIIAQASRTFEAMLERIKPAAKAIVAELRGPSDPPDEVTTGFGLKMRAEASGVLAAAGGGANYAGRLTQKRGARDGR